MSHLQIDTSDGKSSIIGDDTLLIWLDETGDESLSDTNNPTFGIGGCVVEGRHYLEYIHKPWLELRENAFNGASFLHASELESPTQLQLQALSDFFYFGKFCRIASVISGDKAMASQLNPYETCSKSLLERIKAISEPLEYSEIAILFESTDRANSFAKEYISRILISRSDENSESKELPMHHFFVPKHLHEPGLEVADFIVQCAGGESRARNKSNKFIMRKDFTATFQPENENLASYHYLQAVIGPPKVIPK